MKIDKKVIKWTIITALVFVLFFSFLSFYAGKDNLIEALSLFPLGYLPLILLLVTSGWLLRGIRWHYYVKKSNINIPFLRSLHIFLASFSLTNTPGKAGELVKSLFLKEEYDVPIAKTAGILVTERLMDLIGVLLMSLGFLFFSFQYVWLFLIALFLVLFCLAFISFERIYKPILNWFSRFKFLNLISKKVLELLLSSKQLLNLKIISLSVPLSLLAWVMEGVAFFIVLKGFNLPVSLFFALFVYAISTIAGALSMMPGGVLGTEGTMIGLFALKGIVFSSVLPSILLIRLCTIWYIPIIGFFFMIFLLTKKKVSGKR